MSRSNIHLEITINFSKEHIWEVLFGKETFTEWASEFAEGSHLEGDLKKGGTVCFLDPSQNGIRSKVIVHKPSEKITFHHNGGGI
ncbi:MAG: hypothetical protein RIC35_01850 [Marinoscillum sp.]